ncbi:MAG: VWA domain-containing protein [Dehalococcoidia bacterium]|uniref:VWA domain-containing protein n=1 Tax=Candidatus Amarobacter glycogenicus TaxID=3140699 RepID=UPI003134CB57|nr:VWA domain-containing protein [Dehalococcoidia bacterium]MBK6562302.1 VWA domain-containing protein [Dehalococcoidia bacterium]
MSFAWPLALLSLWLVPLAVALYVLAQYRRPKYAARFTNLDLLANVVEKTPGWRRHIPAVLGLLALATLLTSLARPELEHKVPKEEATVVLVTDISGSMTATDIEPTRMAAAQEAAHTMVDELPEGFRIALVTFSAGVRTVVAPTTEKAVVEAAIDALKPLGGTAMGDGIVEGIAASQLDPEAIAATPSSKGGLDGGQSEDSPVIMILLSDGANTLGQTDPIDAAQQAKELGIPIFAIALGTQDGVAVVTDSQGRQRSINVPPDEDTLQEIAATTGGKFFSAPSADDLESIYEDLGSRIGYDIETTEITVGFAAAAAMLVLAAGGLSLLWFNRFP